jgi:hypothetical protein
MNTGGQKRGQEKLITIIHVIGINMALNYCAYAQLSPCPFRRVITLTKEEVRGAATNGDSSLRRFDSREDDGLIRAHTNAPLVHCLIFFSTKLAQKIP